MLRFWYSTMSMDIILIRTAGSGTLGVMGKTMGQDTAVKAAKLGLSLDWLAVLAAMVAVLLVALGWLPNISW